MVGRHQKKAKVAEESDEERDIEEDPTSSDVAGSSSQSLPAGSTNGTTIMEADKVRGAIFQRESIKERTP